MNPRRRVLLVIISILLVPAIAAAQQDPAGHWIGQWEREGATLEVAIGVIRVAGGYEGTLSSDQLRVVGVVFVEMRFEDPRLRWRLVGDETTSDFDGNVLGDTVVGSFREGAARGTFRLSRSRAVAVPLEEETIRFTNGATPLSSASEREGVVRVAAIGRRLPGPDHRMGPPCDSVEVFRVDGRSCVRKPRRRAHEEARHLGGRPSLAADRAAGG